MHPAESTPAIPTATGAKGSLLRNSGEKELLRQLMADHEAYEIITLDEVEKE